MTLLAQILSCINSTSPLGLHVLRPSPRLVKLFSPQGQKRPQMHPNPNNVIFSHSKMWDFCPGLHHGICIEYSVNINIKHAFTYLSDSLFFPDKSTDN